MVFGTKDRQTCYFDPKDKSDRQGHGRVTKVTKKERKRRPVSRKLKKREVLGGKEVRVRFPKSPCKGRRFRFATSILVGLKKMVLPVT